MHAPPDPAERGSVESLGRTALAGARWITLSRVGSEVAAFASSLILARLIAPEAFGHVAIALFVGALAIGLAQQNVGAALVQMQEPTPRHFRGAMAVSLSLGLVLMLVTILVTVALAGVADPTTLELIRLMSLSFVLLAPSAVSQALLQRRLDFRRLSIAEVTAAGANVAVAVTCAVAGLEGTAVILGFLAQCATSSALLVRYARPPAPRMHRAEIAEISRFGLPVSTSSLAYVAMTNVDYVILGARLNPLDVGLYWRAYVVGVDYQAKVSGILLRVAFPLFSRAADLEAVRELRRRIVRLHAVVLFPPLAFLIIAGPTVIPWLYGPEWEEAGTLVQWLAIAGLAQVVATGTGPLVLAQGHAKALRNWNLVLLVGLAAVVWVASSGGVLTVAISLALFRVAAMFVGQYLLVQRLIGIRLADTLREDVLPAATSAVAGMVPAAVVLHTLEAADLPTVVVLAASGLVGVAVYALVLKLAFAEAAQDVRRIASRLLARRRRASLA